MLQPLDFGDLRVLRNTEGYVSVDPRGLLVNSASVLVRRAPMPADLAICGRAGQGFSIQIDQPTLALASQGETPVANRVKNFTLAGDGAVLQQIAPGHWTGTLGSTGSATLHVGATLVFAASGSHGVAGADMAVRYSSSADATALLAVTAITGLPMEVSCESNLLFGAVSLANAHGDGRIAVAEREMASAVAEGTGIAVAGLSHPALCTVSHTPASVTRVVLMGPAQTPGTFVGTTLSAVKLRNANGATLDLSLVTSTANIAANSDPAAISRVFVGGTLQIPSQVEPGTYSETFTIMVTE